jgi:hypothetical protein
VLGRRAALLACGTSPFTETTCKRAAARACIFMWRARHWVWRPLGVAGTRQSEATQPHEHRCGDRFCWRMELSAFDNDLPEGRQLNLDLQVRSLSLALALALAFDLDLARSLARSFALALSLSLSLSRSLVSLLHRPLNSLARSFFAKLGPGGI